MDWLFVVGVSLEIAGALLVGAPFLLPVVLFRWDKLAILGYLFPRGSATAEDIQPTAYVMSGSLLLAAGFGVQLAGYIVAIGNLWFLALASAVICGTVLIGGLLSAGALSRWLLRKAQENDPVRRGEQQEQQTGA